MKKDFYKNTKLVAHRGLSSAEVENTLPAFLLACQSDKVYGVECDIRCSKDGHLVVFHDRDLKRLCGVDNKIKNMTLSEIKSLPMYNIQGKLDYKYHIPTLEEYIDICKTYNKVCFVEIKAKLTPTQLNKLYHTIKTNYSLEKCVFISFHIYSLIYLRLLDKKIVLQHISDRIIRNKPLSCKTFKIGVDYNHRLLKEKTISKYKKLSLCTNVWTINDKKLASKYIAMGVDYITSNYIF